MKPLRQILEAKRTPEKALQLLDRIRKMKPWKDQHPSSMHNLVPHTKSLGLENSWALGHQEGSYLAPKLPKNHEYYWHGEEEVPFSRIRSNQNYISVDDVARKITGDPNNSSKTPIGFDHPDGYVYLSDGNHRVAAARLRGQKTVLVGLYKAGEWKKGVLVKKR